MSFARAEVCGRVSFEPEVKQVGQNLVTKITIGVKDKKTNEYTNYEGEFWNKRAEVVNQYVKKGDTVYITGDSTVRTWAKKDGTIGSAVTIKNAEVKFVNTQQQTQSSYVSDDDLPF